ncbi:MAG TPA: SDR family oxidoreductase [Thermoanaerobaculia bacterium]
MKTTLVTGAAGTLAPFLIHHLLHEDDEQTFVCLGRRPDASETVRRRIAALCRGCAPRVRAPRFRFIVGDTGISIPYDGRVDSVWHFASDLRMDPSSAEAVLSANLAGTRTILDFCARNSATLYYLSTAYVCGTRSGTIAESDLLCGQSFRNAYEESKARSEELVGNWLVDHPGIVFRPSIVIGDTRTGVALSFQGLYRMIWGLWRLRDRVLHRGPLATVLPELVLPLPVALPCSSAETLLNVVGADYVTSLLVAIHRQPSALGRAFHVVNPSPPTLQELLDVTVRLMGVRGIKLVELGAAILEKVDVDLRRLNAWLGDQITVYFPYLWGRHPVFDMSNVRSVLGSVPAHPKLDETTLGRLYQYALDRNFSAV